MSFWTAQLTERKLLVMSADPKPELSVRNWRHILGMSALALGLLSMSVSIAMVLNGWPGVGWVMGVSALLVLLSVPEVLAQRSQRKAAERQAERDELMKSLTPRF